MERDRGNLIPLFGSQTIAVFRGFWTCGVPRQNRAIQLNK